MKKPISLSRRYLTFSLSLRTSVCTVMAEQRARRLYIYIALPQSVRETALFRETSRIFAAHSVVCARRVLTVCQSTGVWGGGLEN